MIEVLFWFFLGVLCGTFTGLIPGLHSNSVSLLVISFFSGDPLHFAVFIVALCITHSVVEIIPSILTGAAEETTFNLLPGQELLLKGRGFEAISLSISGVISALSFSVFLLPVLFSFITHFQNLFDFFLLALILVVLLVIILNEPNFFSAVLVAFVSGLFGFALLNSGIKEVIFSLVTGFFAVPALFYSSKNHKLPLQVIVPLKEFDFRFGFLTSALSCFLSVIPAFGPAHAASLLGCFYRKLTKSEYLLLSGGVGTANLVFGILVLFALGKTRSGMTVIIDSIFSIGFSDVLVLLAVAFSSVGFACMITLIISEKLLSTVHLFDYGVLGKSVLVFVLFLVFFLSGFLGLVVCFLASLVGNYCLKKRVSRSICMCFLLFPTIAFYAGF